MDRIPLFWFFVPLFLLMLVATVYGRYHYVADVIAGLLVGALGFRFGVTTLARRFSCCKTARGKP